MPTMSMAQVRSHDPDLVMPPDPEFAEAYAEAVESGGKVARSSSVAFVAICRNAMPWLSLTRERVEATASLFAESKIYIVENDSVDGTTEYLREWESENKSLVVKTSSLGRPHLNSTKDSSRTIALAEYRNQCVDFVRDSTTPFDWVVVFDTDIWGGFSIGGLLTSLHQFQLPQHENTAGFGSYSWCEFGPPMFPGSQFVGQYDAWALRWTGWSERLDMDWFHRLKIPVGSPPIKFNSCFGQLATYRASKFVNGRYEGGDCEHVPFHRSLDGDMYLNPSSRVVSFWVPQ